MSRAIEILRASLVQTEYEENENEEHIGRANRELHQAERKEDALRALIDNLSNAIKVLEKANA